MKFIFPQNYNFKNKLFGFLDYSTIFLNLIWFLFIFLFINLFFNNINIKIFLFIIFCFPVFLLSLFGFNGENIVYVIFYIFKFLIKNKDINIIRKFIEDSTIINISNDINFKSVTDETINKIIAKHKKDNHTTCTTIHKSKGLEADMVLVVAKNNIELSKWLEIEKEKRYDDISHDVCRRGFVAFSRARELLVISCKEGIDDENKTILQKLNVLEKKFFMSRYLEKA